MKQMMHLLLCLVLIIPGLTCLESDAQNSTNANQPGLFDYDPGTDYQLREDSVFFRDGIRIGDISFISGNPQHGRIKAFLVTPSAKKPCAGIVYFHWLGRPDGNRLEFLDEAVTMARKSVISILIQGYFPWIEAPVSGDRDRKQVIDQTIDLRRAVDILLTRPEVDKNRIAFVGHDYGAMFGSLMSGTDKRVKAYVLVAGMGNFGDWSLKYWEKTNREGAENYRKALAPVDPVHHIARSASASLLFQFATEDIYIDRKTALDFYDAASEPKMIKWYNTAHEMMTPEVRNDRMSWLKEQLDIE